MVGAVHFFNATCTTLGPDCPVEDSIYGYHPHLGINVFLVSAFACLAFVHIYLGIWIKTYFFAGLLAFSCVGESVGYIGRIVLHQNPYDGVGFSLQICCLAFAPSFLAAAIHATLKHITLTFGATTSILPPPMYTWMFIAMDMVCLALLAIGGSLAGEFRAGHSTGMAGYVLILAGIVVQILTLVIFAVLVLDYLYRTRRAWHNVPFAATKLLDTLKFKLFVSGVAIAYTGVLVRCLFRLLELSGGWPNSIMRSQATFVVFESCPILVASLAFTLFHPGFCFSLPRQSRSMQRQWRRTDPSVQGRRRDIEFVCNGVPNRAEVSSQHLTELPDLIATQFGAKRRHSVVTALAARPSQASLAKGPTATWYSIGSGDSGIVEASPSSTVPHLSATRGSSRETWYSDATLKEADADIERPDCKPY